MCGERELGIFSQACLGPLRLTIAEVDLYKYDPWQLPDMALFGKKEWYFFTPRDRKYPNESRPNRAAATGYWKATGADKPVTPEGHTRPLGIKKALVFYTGKAPRGVKTNWIMHEYRLADTNRSANKKGSTLRLDDWVLCRLYNKKNNWEKETQMYYQQQLQQTQQQPKLEMTEDASFGDSMDSSFEAVEETAYDSHSHLTPESDVDNGEYADNSAVVKDGNRTTTVKEDTDQWFMDMNFDDLQNPFATDGLDFSFLTGLLSPMAKTPSQINLLNF